MGPIRREPFSKASNHTRFAIEKRYVFAGTEAMTAEWNTGCSTKPATFGNNCSHLSPVLSPV